MRFDIGGRMRLEVVDADETVLRRLRWLMDPYAPTERDDDATAEILLEANDDAGCAALVDIQNPAQDGIVTASDSRSLYLLEGGRRCLLPVFERDGPVRISYQDGFPVWRIFGSVIRPALHVALLRNASAAIHSSSVEVDGAGIVVAGWSETGKTETALAFMEEGARFVSDKWTIVDSDGRLSCFPISVGIRRWVLRYLPRLRRSLPRGSRAQLLVAGLGSSITKPVRGSNPAGRIGELVVSATTRAVQLADRAALRPSEVGAAYGQSPPPPITAPVDTVALLTTVPDGKVVVRTADATWAARRLARSAAYERRHFFDLYQRSRFALVAREDTFSADVERREEAFLATLLGEVQVLDVHAPFPADPRRVADAILRMRR